MAVGSKPRTIGPRNPAAGPAFTGVMDKTSKTIEHGGTAFKGFRALALAVAFSGVATGSLSATGETPELAFNNNCRTCHSMKPGDNRLGPSLSGVVGRKAGTVQGYPYSPGFKTTDVVWDEANLDKFIANPDSLFPNSNMKPYGGISDEALRARIIEHLKQAK